MITGEGYKTTAIELLRAQVKARALGVDRVTYGDWEVDPTRPAIQVDELRFTLLGVRRRTGVAHPRLRRKVHAYWRDGGQKYGRWHWEAEVER